MQGRFWGVIAVLASCGLAATVDACSGPSGTGDGGPDATSDVASNDVVTTDVGNDVSDAGCTDGSATDPNNCGACGHVCTGGAGCYSGVCGNEATEVSAGLYSACAIMADRTVWCWGDNTYGEIAASSSGDVACSNGACRPVAQQVSVGDGGVKAQHVSVGNYFACLVDTSGTVWCWGRNDHGQLGHSPSTDVFDAGGVPFDFTPSSVSGPPAAMGIAAGRASACAVTTTGAVWCWGDDTTNELAGMEAGAPISPPTAAQVLTTQVQTVGAASTVAEDHLCARKSDGTAWCWGDNPFGERGSTADSGTPPSEVVGPDGGALTDISALATLKWGTCALRSGGSLWCWGMNVANDFGNPNLDAGQLVGPVPTESDSGTVAFADINGHTLHTCGLTSKSDLYCWGDNLYGEIGIGAAPDAGSYNYVQKVPSLSARAVSAGYFFTLAIKNDGTVWAWGDNASGELGHAQLTSETNNGCPTYCSLSPSQVQGLPHP